jgi:two-component system, chemotaxis family, CheB/CheR fusion protein
LSRVTSGKLRLQMQPTRLHDVLRHTYEVCASDANAKRLSIKFDFAATIDWVMGDQARLQQVFWNLMKNAIKFSQAGQSISVRTSNAEGRIQVEMADAGIGIPAELLPRIFDAFEQGDAISGGEFGGLGLGLAISRAVIDMHGGTVTAASAGIGSGATFTVEINTIAGGSSIGPDGRIRDEGSNPVGHVRVLLVEDHRDTARILSRLLTHSGHDVRVAHSGASALELAGEETFDILVSDIGLPDITGYELMTQIKDRHAIKGIALTGYGMEEDMRRSRDAGFSEHVVKPVNIAQLEEAIRRVLPTGG